MSAVTSMAGGGLTRSDLTVELPPLLAAMWSAEYDVFRVMYNRTAWDLAPRTLIVSGRLVKLGGYRTQDAASISLVDTGGWNRIDLVVLPPPTDHLIAEQALALAGLESDPHRAGEIFDHANRRPPAPDPPQRMRRPAATGRLGD
jgi:hypothetical protein